MLFFCVYKGCDSISHNSTLTSTCCTVTMGQFLSQRGDQQAGAGFHATDVPAAEALTLFQEADQTPAFNDTLCSKRFVRSAATDNMEQFLMELVQPMEQYITSMVRRFHSIRVAVFLHPTYAKVSNTGPIAIPSFTPVLRTKLNAVLRTRAIPQLLHSVLETLRSRHATYMRKSSGLRLEEITTAEVQIAKVKYMVYTGQAYAPLPSFLAKKNAVVNVQNTDNPCFGYALISALHPSASHVSRSSHYDRFFGQHPELSNLDYPIQVDQFEEVEQRIIIPFNVFTYYDDEGRARHPLFLSNEDPDTATDLLFWDGHFAWIRVSRGFLETRTRAFINASTVSDVLVGSQNKQRLQIIESSAPQWIAVNKYTPCRKRVPR